MSLSEDLFERSLLLVFGSGVVIHRNYRPDWLSNPVTGKNLELDFYLPEFKIEFEVQGEHHYFDKYQQQKDLYKKTICKKEKIDLIDCSIIQNHPSFIRRILRNKSISFQPITEAEEKHQERCNLYFEKINSKYKKSMCVISPRTHRQKSEHRDRMLMRKEMAYSVRYWDAKEDKVKVGYIARFSQDDKIVLCNVTKSSYSEFVIPISMVREWKLGKKKRIDRGSNGKRSNVIIRKKDSAHLF